MWHRASFKTGAPTFCIEITPSSYWEVTKLIKCFLPELEGFSSDFKKTFHKFESGNLNGCARWRSGRHNFDAPREDPGCKTQQIKLPYVVLYYHMYICTACLPACLYTIQYCIIKTDRPIAASWNFESFFFFFIRRKSYLKGSWLGSNSNLLESLPKRFRDIAILRFCSPCYLYAEDRFCRARARVIKRGLPWDFAKVNFDFWRYYFWWKNFMPNLSPEGRGGGSFSFGVREGKISIFLFIWSHKVRDLSTTKKLTIYYTRFKFLIFPPKFNFKGGGVLLFCMFIPARPMSLSKS